VKVLDGTSVKNIAISRNLKDTSVDAPPMVVIAEKKTSKKRKPTASKPIINNNATNHTPTLADLCDQIEHLVKHFSTEKNI
jgi:hypothetical protein